MMITETCKMENLERNKECQRQGRGNGNVVEAVRADRVGKQPAMERISCSTQVSDQGRFSFCVYKLRAFP